jgi:pimeloyl-ACP methyl ester carboxylesterase/class 3 adenylate cyclase
VADTTSSTLITSTGATVIATRPRTHYANVGDDRYVAYQVFGDRPLDLVFVPTWISQIEALWEEPSVVRVLERMARFSRVILFDRRGTGLSDPVTGAPTLEERMDDVRAVLDAVGSERAALFGFSEGGPMSALFAATYPSRVSALILYGMAPRALRAPDYPWGREPSERPQEWDRIAATYGYAEDLLLDVWGRTTDVEAMSPGAIGDERVYEWLGRLQRLAAGPGAALEILRTIAETDVRDVLPTISVPTLIIHRAGDTIVPVEVGRYVASLMPEAKYVELPGVDHLPILGDSDLILDEMEEFLTGMRHEPEPDRVLSTILFTDIAGSTERAAELGDRRWRDLLATHNEAVRRELALFRGREVKTTGDGFLATFDGPARAIRCACAIVHAMRPLGIEIRAGLHTGECEVMDGDIGGLAVHIAARVAGHAAASEVLASRTVIDLVAGSKLEFQPRGTHRLKGVPGKWQLYTCVSE